jgi:hypothetical protein
MATPTGSFTAVLRVGHQPGSVMLRLGPFYWFALFALFS